MRDFIQLFVCIDCHLNHHTGEVSEHADPAPWSLIEDLTLVADNSICEACFEANVDCEHNNEHFSHSPCDGCGSHLAGERFYYALFEGS